MAVWSVSLFLLSSSLLSPLFLFSALLRIAHASERPTLYAPGDNVLELDVNNFDKSVYKQSTAFFVEFYSSWCGHCIEYKPHFVRFATMIKDWRNVVIVGVLNCADELNAPVCREHAIDGFPTLKYFHVNAKDKDDSVRFDDNKRDLPLMAKRLTEWAKADFDKGLAPASWPRMEFLSNDKSISSIWSDAQSNVQLMVLIVENSPATNAFSTMVNYAGDQRITVSLVSSSHPLATQLGVDKLPGLVAFSRASQQNPIYTSSSSMESWIEMQKKLDELLQPFPKLQMAPLDSHNKGFGAKAEDDHLQQTTQSGLVDWNQFQVQYLDLISAFHYLLYVEVPRNPVLGNTELTALKQFVHLLREHGPGSVPVRRLFHRLDEWLKAQHQPVVATDKYLAKLEEFQTDLGHPIPANTSYKACRGSTLFYRGYTCGLWTLFHILTVQAYKDRKNDSKFDPVKEILEPIHQFVVQFLSCDVCSKNFDKMAKEDGLLNVFNAEDVVLWLWRAHNKVNRRLKGEASEDPKFPKQQFPPATICPGCRDRTGEFNEQKVLQFLVAYYSDVRIDDYKPNPAYKVSEFANGKLEKVAERRLNPKFEPMAGRVDKLEEMEARMRSQKEGGLKRHWRPIEDDYRALQGGTDRSGFHFVWLSLIAVALIIAYFQYRRNRSKFWKTFYYYNDYKL